MKVNNLRAVCIIQITIWQLHHSKCSFFNAQARAKILPNLKVVKFLSSFQKTLSCYLRRVPVVQWIPCIYPGVSCKPSPVTQTKHSHRSLLWLSRSHWPPPERTASFPSWGPPALSSWPKRGPTRPQSGRSRSSRPRPQSSPRPPPARPGRDRRSEGLALWAWRPAGTTSWRSRWTAPSSSDHRRRHNLLQPLCHPPAMAGHRNQTFVLFTLIIALYLLELPGSYRNPLVCAISCHWVPSNISIDLSEPIDLLPPTAYTFPPTDTRAWRSLLRERNYQRTSGLCPTCRGSWRGTVSTQGARPPGSDSDSPANIYRIRVSYCFSDSREKRGEARLQL